MALHLPEAPVAGLVLDVVAGIAGTTIVLTGLSAAVFRTFAVLAEAHPERVEWITAVGFLVGVVFTGILLALDFLLG